MSIFNSLGSNYNFFSAVRTLFAVGGKKSQARLVKTIEHRYSGKVILTYKGREAIQLALASLPRSTDKVVAVNGFTCYAVYQAIVDAGFGVHYLDIGQGSLNFTASTLQQALSQNPRISAVMIQNTLGYPCDITGIMRVCKENKLVLIEDLAHSIGTAYASGEEAGTVGDMVILSFSQDKVVDGVSGGALVVRNTQLLVKEPALARPVKLSQQLKDRLYPLLTWKIRVLHGIGIGKIMLWVCKALHILSTPMGADNTIEIHRLPSWYCRVISREFVALTANLEHKRKVAQVYQDTLDKSVLRFSETTGFAQATNLRFPVWVEERAGLEEKLKKQKIYVSDIWYDAPIAPKKYMHLTGYAGECPQAEFVAEHILNLPTHINVSMAQAKRIATLVNEWVRAKHNHGI